MKMVAVDRNKMLTLMTKRNLSRKELCQSSGLSRETIATLLYRPSTSNMTRYDTARRLAKALRTEIPEILESSNQSYIDEKGKLQVPDTASKEEPSFTVRISGEAYEQLYECSKLTGKDMLFLVAQIVQEGLSKIEEDSYNKMEKEDLIKIIMDMKKERSDDLSQE